ncbi:MAG: peptide deformylase [Nitrospirae bacterium]|nr:MAG: peptide deformylase [Nitrospirota bacterium]
MSVLKIRTYPDPVLKKKALPVEDINGNLQKLIDDMVETMYAAPGIGLAAPQVGELVRLIVVDVSSQQEDCPLIVLLNPEIIEVAGKIPSEEGCLSVPGYVSTIQRAENVLIRGHDREGKPVEVEATGLLARALQHEIDHLNGTLFVDRLSPIKKEFFRKRYLKRLKETS